MIVRFSGHTACSILIENTLDFSYLHVIELMQSDSVNVKLQASNALATFVYNNSRVQVYLNKQYQLSFDYFERFLHDPDDHRRCAAAFQVGAELLLLWAQFGVDRLDCRAGRFNPRTASVGEHGGGLWNPDGHSPQVVGGRSEVRRRGVSRSTGTHEIG